MGVRGNIPKNTRMTIRNLDESYIFWEIWAESIEDFTWWSSTSLWTITEKDQDLLTWKITSSVYADKINTVTVEDERTAKVKELSGIVWVDKPDTKLNDYDYDLSFYSCLFYRIH